MRTRPVSTIALSVLFSGALAVGCGSSGGGGGGAHPVPANPDLTVYAEDIKFDQKQYTVHAGDVQTAYISKGQQIHTLVVQDPKGDKLSPVLRVTPGQKQGATYNLTPGTYTLYCDIPGHRDAGMVATLTVTP
jgi:plastocyanin